MNTHDNNPGDKISRQILKGSKEGHKTYKFDETHDPTKPADMWVQESTIGKILFIVFYTQACRWSRCTACNLPSVSSVDHVNYRQLRKQIDHVFANLPIPGEEIAKVIISNNGSVLDEATFSSTAWMHLIAEINLYLPNMSVLCVETRPEYVDLEELEFTKRALEEGETPAVLQLAIGFEASDDHIRNDVFGKGLSLETFEAFVEKVAKYGYHIKCYFMQKPVSCMTDEEAILDIKAAIDYLSEIDDQYDVKINLHLNPTYVARGTVLAEKFALGEYEPPKLKDVARAVLHAKGKQLSVYIGLDDEGLAVEGGSFIRPGDEELVKQLEEFNKTQNFDILETIVDQG